ncbi:aspartic proteinase cdr1 [Phtheirospermum japonicum]|uniref:Aspartic proteinase cdr1 n=1 Tax=Phtheirospermum japonicum TaxID=374723 RepID=A0A830D1F1_9LAMI|nr:aspartic proteinase cdr1 [Phtheirospermum japonicum]
MANNYRPVAFLFFTIHILTACSSFTNTTGTAKLALKLIHQHGLSDSAIDDSQNDDIRAPVIPAEDGSIFLVNISIGEPPVPQLMAMDTGSHLIWVHCNTCNGCNNIFDPEKSSTYTELSNSRSQCQNYIDASHCGQEYKCKYSVSYLDGSISKGNLALEKFTFVTSTGGEWDIPDLVFGYGLESSGNLNRMSGIVGLQIFNKNSLVSRVGNKFSYCIGNISDPHYAYNRLTLGEGAVLEGYSAPLGIWEGHYVVSLKGIRVGEKQINISQEELDFKVVIDSGSTLIHLHRSVVEQMRQEVRHLLDSHLRRVIVNGKDDLCYQGDLRRDLGGFPMVTLRLAEGAEIYLNVESVFRRVTDNVFCMAVDVSVAGVNIIGVYAQQYYNIGFDLNAMRVSFMSIECELLDD